MAANVRQLSLFSDAEQPGNTIVSHDLLPRFLHNRHKKVLTHDEYAQEGERWVQLSNGQLFNIEPGSVRRAKTGELVYIYPGTRESLVEECIMSFASNGKFDHEVGKPGYIYDGVGGVQVVFTLYQLRMELKKRRKEYNLQELSEALEVLFKSNYCRGIKSQNNHGEKLIPDSKGKRRYMQSFDWIEHEASEQSVIKGETIIRIVLCDEATKQILSGEYLTYDNKCSMEMKSPVTRYLYRYLVQRWRNTNLRGQQGETIEISQNDTINDAGYPWPDNVSKRKAIFMRTVQELIDNDIIQELGTVGSVFEVKLGRKIVDITYHFKPTKAFVKHQIEANVRMKKNKQEVQALLS